MVRAGDRSEFCRRKGKCAERVYIKEMDLGKGDQNRLL